MDNIGAAVEQMKQIPDPWQILQTHKRNSQTEHLPLTRESANQALCVLEICLTALRVIPKKEPDSLPGELGEYWWPFAGVAALDIERFQLYDGTLLRRSLERQVTVMMSDDQFELVESVWLHGMANSIITSVLHWLSDSCLKLTKYGRDCCDYVDLKWFGSIVEQHWLLLALGQTQELLFTYWHVGGASAEPLLKRLFASTGDPELRAIIQTCLS